MVNDLVIIFQHLVFKLTLIIIYSGKINARVFSSEKEVFIS